MNFDAHIKKIKKHFDFKQLISDMEINQKYINSQMTEVQNAVHTLIFKNKLFIYTLTLSEQETGWNVSLNAQFIPKSKLSYMLDQLVKEKGYALTLQYKNGVLSTMSKVQLIRACKSNSSLNNIISQCIQLIKSFELAMSQYVLNALEYTELKAKLNCLISDGRYANNKYFYMGKGLFDYTPNMGNSYYGINKVISATQIDTQYYNWFVKVMLYKYRPYVYKQYGTIPSETVNIENVIEKAKQTGKSYTSPASYLGRWLMGKGNKLEYEFEVIKPKGHGTRMAKKIAQRQHHKKVRNETKYQLSKYVKGNDIDLIVSDTPNKWWD